MPSNPEEKAAEKATEKSMNKLDAIFQDVQASLDNMGLDPDEVWQFPEGSIGTFTDMTYWYPRISDLAKTPRTLHVPVPDRCNLILLVDRLIPKHLDDFMNNLAFAINRMGTPCFLRTGFTSSKHFWNQSCYLKNPDNLIFHVRELAEFSAIIDQPVTDFFVRELIKTRPIFHTRHGMPVTREFRLFLVDDKVSFIQPYWPADALEHLLSSPEPENWREHLKSISQLTPEEYAFLEKETLKLRQTLPDYDWSVDWLQDSNGTWWLTDMARAEHSYTWKPDFQVILD